MPLKQGRSCELIAHPPCELPMSGEHFVRGGFTPDHWHEHGQSLWPRVGRR